MTISIVPFLFIHMNTGWFGEVFQWTESVLVAMRTFIENLRLKLKQLTEEKAIMQEQTVKQVEAIVREKASEDQLHARGHHVREGQVHARGGHCAQDGEITVT